jgi:phytoene desaturase
MKKVTIIGSGFAALSSACFLAKAGFSVSVLEKNDQPGGRARVFSKDGFTFDMGPSWYWMPDVFERFFNLFEQKVSDHYHLIRLEPSYRVFFEGGEYFDVPSDWQELGAAFEKWEPGSAKKLEKFLLEAEVKYREGLGNMVFKPSLSILEFANWTTFKGAFQLDLLTNFKSHVTKFFSHPKILKILEFPVLFLGSTPEKTPALYSLMNYADLKLGTWYPQNGMYEIVRGMYKLATSLGVEFNFNQEVTAIHVSKNGFASEVETKNGSFSTDIVLVNADYAHADQKLLAPEWRSYSPEYWESRVMAPSSLLYYCGLNQRVKNLKHHNLFFDEDFAAHAKEIYEQPQWPTKPLFYLSAPSLTDSTIAPAGKENLFFLIPTAPGILEDEKISDRYFDFIANKVEIYSGNLIRKELLFKVPFGPKNFVSDYHAHKANAYGLANTLMQTAVFKPSLKSKKVKNLFFTGQLTVPGPGVPPSIISGEVVAKEIIKQFLK